MQCPVCNTALPAGARFCNVCGAPVPQEMACARCGQPVKPGQKFCMICGAAVTLAPSATGPVSTAPTTPAPPARRARWWLWLIPIA
ncbi:MAG: zinc ribbon domain-containing protein, partial [Anaerolineae bacterium]|nr:zinc ribbon domain-containing protein [Anaerolineae bacterium]